jgi:hypothetical protein
MILSCGLGRVQEELVMACFKVLFLEKLRKTSVRIIDILAEGYLDQGSLEYEEVLNGQRSKFT